MCRLIEGIAELEKPEEMEDCGLAKLEKMEVRRMAQLSELIEGVMLLFWSKIAKL